MERKPAILIVGGGLLQVPAVIKAKELGYMTYVTDAKESAPAQASASWALRRKRASSLLDKPNKSRAKLDLRR